MHYVHQSSRYRRGIQRPACKISKINEVTCYFSMFVHSSCIHTTLEADQCVHMIHCTFSLSQPLPISFRTALAFASTSLSLLITFLVRRVGVTTSMDPSMTPPNTHTTLQDNIRRKRMTCRESTVHQGTTQGGL